MSNTNVSSEKKSSTINSIYIPIISSFINEEFIKEFND